MKGATVGLPLASVWVPAVVIGKFLLHGRTRPAMDVFEQTFCSGHSLRDIYRSLSALPPH